MAESNGAWGELARDDDLAQALDQYERLPEPGSIPALDAFVARKHIDIPALVRLGARIEAPDVLVFPFPGGIKFRDIVTDRRWSLAGSRWRQLKIVRSGPERAEVVIVAEGETDAARLTMLYPAADVAVLPAGADPRPYAADYAGQLNDYGLVLLAQDPDRAGNDGAALLAEHLTTKHQRWTSPAGDDWSALDAEPPPLPRPEDVDVPIEDRILLTTRELLTLPRIERASLLEQELLPVGGTIMLHGAMKSFKSYLAFDLAAALAQSSSWAGFEVVDEPQLVAIMQYEIPPAYYEERVRALHAAAQSPDLLDENLIHWTPRARPRFRAGDRNAEDDILRVLTKAGVTVFLLDPIRRAAAGADLNSEKEIAPMMDFFGRLNSEGITVITTHHDNKASSRGGSGDPYGMTGSGRFGGDPDTIVSVALPKGCEITSPERNLHFLLRNAPSPSARSMRITDEGALEYSLQPVGDEDAAPTTGSDQPAI